MQVSLPATISEGRSQRPIQRIALLVALLSSLGIGNPAHADVAAHRLTDDAIWADGPAPSGNGDDRTRQPSDLLATEPRCPHCQLQSSHDPRGPRRCPHCGQFPEGPPRPWDTAEPAALLVQPQEWEPPAGGLSWEALGDWLPVLSEPWQRRPLGGGAFLGALLGDEVLQGQIDLRSGLLYGARLTGDWRGAWAWECRLATATLDAVDLTARPPRRDRDADVVLGDVSLVYAPVWTNRLRPFVSAGLGFAFFEFADPRGRVVHETALGLPLGAGIKYRWDDWLLAYLEFRDQIALGDSNQLQTTHNFAIVAGAEIRFGGSRRSYYPWNPSRLGP
jgi:hypothetical protein